MRLVWDLNNGLVLIIDHIRVRSLGQNNPNRILVSKLLCVGQSVMSPSVFLTWSDHHGNNKLVHKSKAEL